MSSLNNTSLPANADSPVRNRPFGPAELLRRETEDEVLLRCARAHLGARQQQQLRSLVGDGRTIRWERLTTLAFVHGVTPLLYRALETVCPEAVPAAVRADLGRLCQARAGHNLFLTGELLSSLEVLESHGVQAVVLKGPLCAMLYGDLSLRFFDDIDILVRRQDVLKAKNLLVEQGFEPPRRWTESQDLAHLRSQHHHYPPLSRGGGRTRLEIHWRLEPGGFSLAPEDIWDRVRPLQLGGRPVWGLCPEDLLLYLSAHGTRHVWWLLRWICDVAELIRASPNLDWEAAFRRARGRERPLRLGLFLANSLLGAPLPDFVQRRIQADPAIPSLASHVSYQLFQNYGQMPDSAQIHSFSLRVQEGLGAKILCLCNFARMRFRRRQGQEQPVPMIRFFPAMYYAWRPFQLIKQYGFSSLKQFWKLPRP